MKEFDSLFDIPITFSGKKGDKGDRGLRGFKGDDGESIKGEKGYAGESIKGDRGVSGKNGTNGVNGKSGKNGVNGISIKGDKGDDGLSAYEVWLQDNEGTEKDFLKSLKGKDGQNRQWHGNSFTELQELLVVGGDGIDITENTISLDIDELTETATVKDGDEFAVSRGGELFKVTAETLATYNSGTRVESTTDANYNITTSDTIILANALSNEIDTQLPPAADFYDAVNDIGYSVQVKKIDTSANTVDMIATVPEVVENLAKITIFEFGDTYKVVSDGTGWWVK